MRFRMVAYKPSNWKYGVLLQRKSLFGWRQVSSHQSDSSLARCITEATERMEREAKDNVLFDTKYDTTPDKALSD